MTSGDSRRVRPLLAALLLLSVETWSPSASAAETGPAADWDVKQLMQGLRQVKTARGKFVEHKYLSMLNAPLEFSGTLSYTAPGHLEKNTLLPKPEGLVLEQDRLTIESKARNQRRTLTLQDNPVIWAFVESIRSTLAGDLETLSRFYRVTLEGNPARWRLLLVPNEPQMQAVVSEIRVSGSKSWINTIEIIETAGDRSVMTITEDSR
jgi:outer membrane lipoprotein carrier protein LolA